MGLSVGIFSGTMKSNDGLYLAAYCIIFVDDVTELIFTVKDAHCTKKA